MERREWVLAERINGLPGWSPVSSEPCFVKHCRGRGIESKWNGACADQEGIWGRMNMHCVGVIGQRDEHEEANAAEGVVQGQHTENGDKHSGSDMESEYTTVICKKALGGYFNKAWISACVEAELAFFHFEIAAKPSSK